MQDLSNHKGEFYAWHCFCYNERKFTFEVVSLLEKISQNLLWIRKNRPLIHQITNYVSANDCANATLALGASPVMAHDINEVEEMTSKASALVLNIGTLSSINIPAYLKAGITAKEKGIPVVFDPVGVGATKQRTAVAKAILAEVQPDIVRCNMTELNVLCDRKIAVKGVDSVASEDGAKELAMEFAEKNNTVVAVTGKRDLVVNKKNMITIENGDEWLTKVTGTGCMTSALVASFAAAGNPFLGAAAGVLTMGVCGELAKLSLAKHEGIGTFRIRLIDVIFQLNRDIIKKYGKIS